ncbi:hypothetical protein [Actinoplanes sp. NPDC023714]|uniref:hypothetical protein n=1 Tax=Actinoplanes sp. NPDC023714 TaxID=3154322 RepID=UPI0033F6512F
MPEPQFSFGTANFGGGQQIFGNENTVSQTNNYEPSPREQVESNLATIRESHPDRELARREIPVIEEGLNNPTPENRSRMERALTRLADTTGDARTAAEAIAAITLLVAANWPF